VGRIVLTSREGHGRCRRFQEALDWPVLVQEQEAFLLPGVKRLESFGEEAEPQSGLRLLWTPGPSPGASVVHAHEPDVLFCGRLLVPTGVNRAAPLRTSRTFHWPRQLRSLERLGAWLPPGSPAWIASGAALGALRGGRLIENGGGLLEELLREVAAKR
jgi:glyoxylase-like metal-dependent hydrolase (beta-lactamase superfamily II)